MSNADTEPPLDVRMRPSAVASAAPSTRPSSSCDEKSSRERESVPSPRRKRSQVGPPTAASHAMTGANPTGSTRGAAPPTTRAMYLSSPAISKKARSPAKPPKWSPFTVTRRSAGDASRMRPGAAVAEAPVRGRECGEAGGSSGSPHAAAESATANVAIGMEPDPRRFRRRRWGSSGSFGTSSDAYSPQLAFSGACPRSYEPSFMFSFTS